MLHSNWRTRFNNSVCSSLLCMCVVDEAAELRGLIPSYLLVNGLVRIYVRSCHRPVQYANKTIDRSAWYNS
jgi:hypothetical protein